VPFQALLSVPLGPEGGRTGRLDSPPPPSGSENLFCQAMSDHNANPKKRKVSWENSYSKMDRAAVEQILDLDFEDLESDAITVDHKLELVVTDA